MTAAIVNATVPWGLQAFTAFSLGLLFARKFPVSFATLGAWILSFLPICALRLAGPDFNGYWEDFIEAPIRNGFTGDLRMDDVIGVILAYTLSLLLALGGAIIPKRRQPSGAQ